VLPARGLCILALSAFVLSLYTLVAEENGAKAGAESPYQYHLSLVGRDGAPGTIGYQVKQGDTLRAVAHRFHTSAAGIASLNGVPASYAPVPGEYLLVPAPPYPQASELIYHGSRASNRIALTFDMGGRVDPALDIMQWLIDNRVPATIFMTGSMVDNPYTDYGRRVLYIVEANLDLFELGNHSYSHPDFTTLSAAGMVSELNRTQESIGQYVTLRTPPLFRPPFGAQDGRVLYEVGHATYTKTIMWDIDTIDWLPPSEGGPSASDIVAKVVNNAQGGSIVLMHLGGYNTYAALPGIVSGLRARGFEFVTVGELLGP